MTIGQRGVSMDLFDILVLRKSRDDPAGQLLLTDFPYPDKGNPITEIGVAGQL
jgi:hypothetical protein